MKVVIDTNVLLTSLSSKSADHWVFRNFLLEKYVLCVTTDILLEYEEIIAREMGPVAANDFMQMITNAPNVELVNIWFKWQIIKKDQDDNKFVDCAIACGASYIVSEDRHFRILEKIPFPKVNVLSTRAFSRLFHQ